MLTRSHPVLASLNVPKTVEFYEEKLNFKSTWKDENYGIVVRDNIAIHFWHCNDKIFPENTSCYIEVTDVDGLYQEMTKAGVVHPNGPLKDQPHGMREFAILDLDGNLIKFGQEIT
ncbi:bleomycin resistance protein [Flexithrix dorotheae]|uniref:bleomycin resistance protein n=1 Tax=Flexithrix dorotheae TaxID=70993 RepID=UPI00036874C2|nr:VOC family protein [Flexithrix dorotheae]